MTSIRTREKMYAKSIKQPFNTKFINAFLLYRNIFNKMIKKSKKIQIIWNKMQIKVSPLKFEVSISWNELCT